MDYLVKYRIFIYFSLHFMGQKIHPIGFRIGVSSERTEFHKILFIYLLTYFNISLYL